MVSYTHLPTVVVELFDTEGFSEGVSQILLSVNLLKINVTSINDLSHKVKAVQNVFGPMVRLWLLSLSNGSCVVTIQKHRTI